jgi:hypothetical protein
MSSDLELSSITARYLAARRMIKMTPEQRSAVASLGGKARVAKLSRLEQIEERRRLRLSRKRTRTITK